MREINKINEGTIDNINKKQMIIDEINQDVYCRIKHGYKGNRMALKCEQQKVNMWCE